MRGFRHVLHGCLILPTALFGQDGPALIKPGNIPFEAVAPPTMERDQSVSKLKAEAELVLAPTRKPTKSNPWNIRAEILMVEVPESLALELLPDLRDDAKIEGAYTRLLSAIKQQQAKLAAYPIVLTKDGEQGTSETINELIYPTQYQPPEFPANFNGKGDTANLTSPTNNAGYNFAACPTNFEKRNVGATLQIEANVHSDGKWIDVGLAPQRVIFNGFDWYEALKTALFSTSIPQPQIYTTKVSGNWTVRSGQRVLSGFHKLVKPEGWVELDVLQVAATLTGDQGTGGSNTQVQ